MAGTELVLLGILQEPTSVGARILAQLGVSEHDVRQRVETSTDRGAPRLDQEDADALQSLGIDLEDVRRAVEQTFGADALDKLDGYRPEAASGRIGFTSRSKKAMKLALRESARLGHTYVGTEHLLLALARDERSAAMRSLRANGLDGARVRAAVLSGIAGDTQPGRDDR